MSKEEDAGLLHNIEVKLYPNYLPNAKEPYIARADNNKTIGIRDICEDMVRYNLFNGTADDLESTINVFFGRMCHHVADGFAFSNKWFCMAPKVSGGWLSPHETFDPEKHRVRVSFYQRKALLDLIKQITVTVEGLADTGGFIDEFEDLEEHSVNTLFVPGNMFAIHGHKIKVEGTHADVGVWITPVDNPTARVKVTRLGENTSSKITGIAPQTQYMTNRIEIVTQSSGSSDLLKAPRTIVSFFTIEEA